MVFDRIDGVLREKHISRRQLARMANIPESTLSSAFARRPQKFPIEYIKKIADALGVPWWELAGLPVEEIDGQKHVRRLYLEEKMLANHEKFHGQEAQRCETLLSHYDKLNDDGQQKAVKRVQGLTEIPRYRKRGEQTS